MDVNTPGINVNRSFDENPVIIVSLRIPNRFQHFIMTLFIDFELPQFPSVTSPREHGGDSSEGHPSQESRNGQKGAHIGNIPE